MKKRQRKQKFEEERKGRVTSTVRRSATECVSQARRVRNKTSGERRCEHGSCGSNEGLYWLVLSKTRRGGKAAVNARWRRRARSSHVRWVLQLVIS
jgi:hypothetical protein